MTARLSLVSSRMSAVERVAQIKTQVVDLLMLASDTPPGPERERLIVLADGLTRISDLVLRAVRARHG